MIAVCHPGKLGDALWAWPLARYLRQFTGDSVTFVTSEYCLPLERLCRAQAWCSDFVVSRDYVLDNWGCGGQPPTMPVPHAERYSRIVQCGFTTTPDRCLADWICLQAGVPSGAPVQYEIGEPTGMAWDRPMAVGYGKREPFVVLASKGPTTFAPLFREFAEKCPVRVVEVGGRGDRVGETTVDATGLDFLVTCSIIREARAFVGLMSSQLVLANGWPIPRIAVHNGVNWDMRHVLRSEWNHYPVNPTADELLGMLGI